MIEFTKLIELTSHMSVLYVEDDADIRDTVEDYLIKLFHNIKIAEDGLIGLQAYQSKSYDLILTDIMMPNMNGLEMSKKIREINKDQEIIIMSAYTDVEYFTQSILIGISGYIIKPMNLEQMNEALYRSVVKINALKELEAHELDLIQKVKERTSELNMSIKNERILQKERIDNYEKTIYSFIEMVEKRDSYTAGHSQRVANYAKKIAEFMNYDIDECDKLYQAAMLHDIGKVATPDSVLLKPGKLNDLEYRLIQEHVVTSYNLLRKIPMYTELAEIVRHHHERCDGKGYPNKIAGDDIPPLSRILILADAFDAMTTNRIYKKRLNLKDAIKEVQNLKGIQFHTEVVDAMVVALKNIKLKDNINQLPETDLEEVRFAYFFKDLLTDLYNKSYLELILIDNKDRHKYNYIYSISLLNFTQYNERFSWKDGDNILSNVASFLKSKYPNCLIFRINGDDFIILSSMSFEINIKELENNDDMKESKISFALKKTEIDTIDTNNIDALEELLLQ